VKSRTVVIVAALLAVAGAGAAEAATFSVNPTQIYLTGKSNSSLLTLRNDSSEPLRFQLSAFAWAQSTSGEIQLEPTKDVVFFPALLTLKPGEERRVRIGSVVPVGARESTYRVFVEELPPLEATTQGAAVRMLTKMGIPIFVRPASEREVMTVDGLAAAAGRLRFALANGGSVHVIPKQITARATDAGGKPVFEQDVPGWYILAGGRRDFDVEVAQADCARVANYTVSVEYSGGTITRTLPTPQGACAAQ